MGITHFWRFLIICIDSSIKRISLCVPPPQKRTRLSQVKVSQRARLKASWHPLPMGLHMLPPTLDTHMVLTPRSEPTMDPMVSTDTDAKVSNKQQTIEQLREYFLEHR